MKSNFGNSINQISADIKRLSKMIEEEYELKLHNREIVKIAIETGITMETASNIFNMSVTEVHEIMDDWEEFVYKKRKGKEDYVLRCQNLLKGLDDIIYAENLEFDDILLKLASLLEQMAKELYKIPDVTKSISGEKLWRNIALKKALHRGLDLDIAMKIFKLAPAVKVYWTEYKDALSFSQRQIALNMIKAGFSHEKVIELCECSEKILKSIEK